MDKRAPPGRYFGPPVKTKKAKNSLKVSFILKILLYNVLKNKLSNKGVKFIMGNLKKIISILLVLSLCLPFIFACGDSGNGGSNPEPTAETTPEPETEPIPETTPAPTEPTTERPTEPPTEPPTDPAALPDADVMAVGEDEYRIIPGARYYLWSPNSNLYLTVEGAFRFAGFIQDEFHGGPAQMFVFEKVGVEETAARINNIYKIRALGTPAGYIDVEGGISEEDGSGVIATAEPEGERSHEWTLRAQRKSGFDDVDLPVFSVMSAVSRNYTRCLDVNGVSTSPGGNIHLWGGGSANNQKWFFELVSDVEAGNIIPRGLQEIPAE